MPLYKPPLSLKSFREIYTQKEINDALNGFTTDYFYTGKREGKSDNITLLVVTKVMDWQENIFIRECEYFGQQHEWKTVIKNQLLNHLKELGVEDGLVNSETRYFDVSQDNHFIPADYKIKLSKLIAKVKRPKQ